MEGSHMVSCNLYTLNLDHILNLDILKYIKHPRQCLITYPNTEKEMKIQLVVE